MDKSIPTEQTDRHALLAFAKWCEGRINDALAFAGSTQRPLSPGFYADVLAEVRDEAGRVLSEADTE